MRPYLARRAALYRWPIAHANEGDGPMTDQDEDETEDLGKIGVDRADQAAPDVEGHASRTARVAADATDDDDVEGHFSSIRSTRSKGD
jgi:hypothetical protein